MSPQWQVTHAHTPTCTCTDLFNLETQYLLICDIFTVKRQFPFQNGRYY